MKFIKLEQKLQLQTKPTTYTETSYWGTDITNDGVNIIINNAYDPNINDITVAYIDITEPVTADIDELTQVLRCWVLEGISAVKVFNSTPWILDADCNALQNVANSLYWRGLPITGGGGGITLVRNGLTENPVGTVSLGGTIQDNPTTINTDGNQFRIGNVNADGAGLTIEFDYNQLLSSVNNQLRTDDSLNYSLLDQFNNKIEITSFDSVSNTTSILRVGEKFGTRGIFLDHLDAGMNSQVIMDSTRSQFSYSDGGNYSLILAQINNASMNVTTGILSSTISIDNNIGKISINSDLCELYINTPTTAMVANGAVLTLLNNGTGECQFVNEWTETIVNLSALDILALGSGVVLLPSLISGEYYNIDSIIIEFSPNTTPYTMAGIGNIQLSYGTASVYIDNQFILGFSENVVMIKDPIKSSGTAVYNYIDSTAGDTVVLTTDTGLSPLVGDGTAKAKIKYKIETFGL